MSNFLYDYFGKTITEDANYNLLNTFIYAILALVLFFYVIKPIIKKFYGKLDLIFFLFLFNIIFLGSMLRVAEEFYSVIQWFSRSHNPLELGFWFITPGIYFLLTFFAIIILIATYFIFKKWQIKKEYLLFTLPLPLALGILVYFVIKMTYRIDFFLIILAIVFFSALIYLVSYYLKIKLTKFEMFAIIAQLTDGIATFSALNFYNHFREQHVFSELLMQSFGVIAFPILKLVLVFIVIFILRKSKISYNNQLYILLFITLFGFATGLRNLFSIALHVI
jgi:uncharacterized membrane protein